MTDVLDRRKADTARRWWAEQPWVRWRGPDKRVSRINLMFLMSGFIDSPTTRERQVAVWRLWGTPNQYGTGIITPAEIAERVGLKRNTVYQYMTRTRQALREQRTARRLADAKWRAWHKHGMRR